jgi:hypothetical protein
MKLLRTTTAALFLGTATLAAAQTASESFADQFKQMQSLQAVGTYTFKPAPTLGSRATDPVARQSFADNFAVLQAESSNSSQWNPAGDERASTYASAPADPVAREPFADRFAEMQAISSKSDAWKFAPSEGEPAYATAGSTTVASPATMPTFVQRIARALNRSGSAQ